MSVSKEDKTKFNHDRKSEKLTREEKLANALKRNIKLRKKVQNKPVIKE